MIFGTCVLMLPCPRKTRRDVDYGIRHMRVTTHVQCSVAVPLSEGPDEIADVLVKHLFCGCHKNSEIYYEPDVIVRFIAS